MHAFSELGIGPAGNRKRHSELYTGPFSGSVQLATVTLNAGFRHSMAVTMQTAENKCNVFGNVLILQPNTIIQTT